RASPLSAPRRRGRGFSALPLQRARAEARQLRARGRMRELADAERIRRFMGALGLAARDEATCYLAGGATAVLLGWRATTIDVDVCLVPEADELLRAIQRLKDELSVNVELASPADFLPLPAGWEERSLLAGREGSLTFRHVDLYSQALAKLERAHAQDLA